MQSGWREKLKEIEVVEWVQYKNEGGLRACLKTFFWETRRR